MGTYYYLRCSRCQKTLEFCKGKPELYDLNAFNYIDFLQFSIKHLRKCAGSLKIESEYCLDDFDDPNAPQENIDDDPDLNEWFFPGFDINSATLQGEDEDEEVTNGYNNEYNSYKTRFKEKKQIHLEYIKKQNEFKNIKEDN